MAAARLDAVRVYAGLLLVTEAAVLGGVADADATPVIVAKFAAERGRVRLPEARGIRY